MITNKLAKELKKYMKDRKALNRRANSEVIYRKVIDFIYERYGRLNPSPEKVDYINQPAGADRASDLHVFLFRIEGRSPGREIEMDKIGLYFRGTDEEYFLKILAGWKEFKLLWAIMEIEVALEREA